MLINGHEVSGGLLAIAVGAPFMLVYGEYWFKKQAAKKERRKRRRQAGFKTMKSTDRRARERAERFEQAARPAWDPGDI